MLANLSSAIGGFDAVLVADQAETSAGGVVTPAVREAIIALAGKYPEKIFLVDSRRRVHLFRNLMVKPNHSEAEAACQALFGSVDFRRLRQALGAKALFLTHGPKGALVFDAFARAPSFIQPKTKFEPMNPAPPVTRIVWFMRLIDPEYTVQNTPDARSRQNHRQVAPTGILLISRLFPRYRPPF